MYNFPPPPRTPYKWIFLNLCPNFRQKFDKTWKNFEKLAKFSWKFFKNCQFFIDFFTNFLETSPASGGGLRPRNPPGGDPSYKPSIGGPRSPPRKKFLRSLRGNLIVFTVIYSNPIQQTPISAQSRVYLKRW